MPKKDSYLTWIAEGRWPEYRDRLIKGALNNYTDKEIASCLNISQATFIQLKRKHPEIIQTMEEAKTKDRQDLLDCIRILAKGATDVVQRKAMKTKGGEVKEEKVIGEVIHKLPPNLNACQYLLAVVHGEQYSADFRRLKLMEAKAMEDLEGLNNAEIIGADSDKEN